MMKIAFGLLAGLALGACGAQDGNVGNPTSSKEDTIIGGFDVTGKNLDAVGSLAIIDPATGEHFSICTATLIGPQTILTAKHCTIEIDMMSGSILRFFDFYDMYFDIGNDSNHARSVKIVDATWSPVMNSGALGLGSDLGIYHLETAVSDVTTFPVLNGGPTKDMLGQKATAIGYGVQSNLENLGVVADNNLRKAGSTTITALSGNFLQLALGMDYKTYYDLTMADLVAYYGKEAVDGCEADADCKASLDASIQASYDANNLNPGYEFWSSRQAGDVVTCYGDSGGPLLKKINGKQTILAVVSWGTGSDNLACDYGTVYSTVGPISDKWVADNTNWTDPCGGTSIVGSCQGNTVVRCTGKGEGLRALQQYNCEDVDQTCTTLANGNAGCTDAGSEPGSGAASQITHKAQDVASAVFAATRMEHTAKTKAGKVLAKFKK